MFRLVTRYLHYVRRQPHAIREVHALLFATVGTLLFVFCYLYVSSVSNEEDAEGKPVVSTTFESPFSLFSEQVSGIISHIKDGGTVNVVNGE